MDIKDKKLKTPIWQRFVQIKYDRRLKDKHNY